jgi:short chain dehydrogenase
MTDRSGKVALVTGSAPGIGKAIAVRYAQLGTDIVINYSGDEANALKTVAEIGESGATGRDAIAVKADVTKPLDIERFSPQRSPGLARSTSWWPLRASTWSTSRFWKQPKNRSASLEPTASTID